MRYGNVARYIDLRRNGLSLSGGVDNIVLNAGSGGATLATDDVAGIHHQMVKVEFGALDSATLVTTAVGLPTDPLDRAARDCGKVDVALLDQYTPVDQDTVGTFNCLPVAITVSGSGGVQITGDAANGLDVDVTRLSALVAGSAIIGKVGIDQTTPGTTNRVDVGAALPAGTNNIGDVDIITVPADPFGANADAIVAAGAVGSIQAKLRRMTQGLEDLKTTIVLAAGSNAFGKLAANDGIDIGDVTINNVTGSAVFVQPGSGASFTVAQSTASSLKTEPAGQVAHDGADSSNPVKIGARAISSPAGLTLVAANDRTDLFADLDGAQLVRPYTAGADILAERITDTTGNSVALTNFGATANARNYVSTIVIFNSSATAGFVDLRDGTAGSVIFTVPAPAGSGAVINLPVPLRQPTVNTALAYDASAALSTIYLSLVGFKSKL